MARKHVQGQDTEEPRREGFDRIQQYTHIPLSALEVRLTEPQPYSFLDLLSIKDFTRVAELSS